MLLSESIDLLSAKLRESKSAIIRPICPSSDTVPATSRR